MSRSPIALMLGLALLLAASRAAATVKPEPVQVRVVGEAPVLRPGEPATIEFEVVSPLPVLVSGLSVTSASLAAPFAPGSASIPLVPGVPVPMSVQVLPSSKPAPLVLRWEVDGEPFERTVDLEGRLESRLAARRALEQVDAPKAFRPDPRLQAEADSVLRAKEAAGLKSTLIFYSGRITYTRPGGNGHPTVDLGAWGVRVSLRDEDYGFDDELGSTFTTPDGYFSSYVAWDGQLGEGDPELYLHFETDHPWVVVQEGFWDVEYSWDTPVRPSSTASLHIGTMRPSDSSTHPALHIATNFARNHEWYRTYPRDWFLESIDVKWPDGSTGARYDPIFGQVHIGTDRQWREDTHAHEYGHVFVDRYAGWVSPNYCNGLCDTGDCGHCLWCPEGADEAMTEGWPNWIANVQTSAYASLYGAPAIFTRNLERIADCDATGAFESPETTEGFLTAVLQDVWDSGSGTDDTDPNGLGGYRDVLELGDDEIMEVLDVDEPTTARGFLTAFANRYPQHRQKLWMTAMNSRWDLDQQPPGAPSGVTSSSHPVGAGTAKLNVSLAWSQPGPDDWSGVAGYSIAFAASPAMPDLVLEAPATGSWTSGDLAAGTYYATVRTVDFSGRGSSTYATYGPFTVVTPTPVDIAPYTAPGWARPLVARATADATATSVPNPTAQLPGNTAPTYMNMSGRNQGQTDQVGFLGIRSRIFVDGVSGHTSAYVHPDAAGATFSHLNRAVSVRGGRHMVGAFYDAFNEWWESNEVNNYWSHPWIWTPLALTADVAVRRQSPPPNPTGSWFGVVDGSPLHYNCDGLRFTSSGPWNAVWLAADSDADDYGIRLHAASSSVNSGFDTVLGAADHPAGYLDGVLVNRNTMGQVAWDLGVVNDLDPTNNGLPQSPFVVKHVRSTPFTWGATAAVAFADSEYVVLKEVLVPQAGPVAITVQAEDADVPVYVSWLDRSYGRGALDTPHWTWPGGAITLDAVATAAGSHCVVLHRDPRDGRSARTVTLRVGVPLGDLVAYAPPGWAGPLVPRPLADGAAGAVAEPDSLVGGSPAYVNLAFRNDSAAAMAAPAFVRELSLDGVVFDSQVLGALAAGAGSLVNNVATPAIPGGRHLLAVRLDAGNAEAEESEGNNRAGDQWVWSPAVLSPGDALWSAAPPDPVGDFASYSGSGPLFYNCLGWRVEMGPGDGQWLGVATSPADTSDVDLRLHEPAAGARDGFGASLHSSSWGGGSSDYLLARGGGPRVLDVSAVRGQGEAAGPFALSVAGAHPVLAGPATSGDVPLRDVDVLGLHLLALPAGDVRLRVAHVDGDVDWGLAVHDDDLPIQGKAEALAAAWEAGPGAGEELVFHVDEPDTFVVAVWKRGGAAGALPGTYRLSGETLVSAAPGPAPARVSALGPASPAPFSAGTRLSFELAGPGPARLEVFDLRGARLRTIVNGDLAGGRHEYHWRGDDDEGRRLAPGVYLLRLTAGGQSWSGKVVKVD